MGTLPSFPVQATVFALSAGSQSRRTTAPTRGSVMFVGDESSVLRWLVSPETPLCTTSPPSEMSSPPEPPLCLSPSLPECRRELLEGLGGCGRLHVSPRCPRRRQKVTASAITPVSRPIAVNGPDLGRERERKRERERRPPLVFGPAQFGYEGPFSSIPFSKNLYSTDSC